MKNRDGEGQNGAHGARSDLLGSFSLELEAVAYAVQQLVAEGCDVPTALYRTYVKYQERFIEQARLSAATEIQ